MVIPGTKIDEEDYWLVEGDVQWVVVTRIIYTFTGCATLCF